jgi:hypothetical protein
VSLTDVVLVRNQLDKASQDRLQRTTLIKKPMDLGDDLWIGCLDSDLRDQILKACQSPGLNYALSRAWGVMYALYRTNPPEDSASQYGWDPDGRLSLAIRLSRLVHPTSIDYEYTARVIDRTGEQRIIAPSHIVGWGTTAYVLDTASNWLTTSDVAELRTLLASHHHDSLSERVKSALFYYEYAALTYFTDLRWVAITTACESLIHIDGERDPKDSRRYAGSTRVFVSRMSHLTGLVLPEPVSDHDLTDMYRQRSALAHGQDFTGFTPEKRRLYGLHENSLRCILKRAVLDPAFAAMFRDDAAIQAAMPI